MVATARHSKHQHKRHGHHQKRTNHFLKVYSPYIPLTLIVITGLVFSSFWQPKTSKHGVLAYATDVSISDLLAITNQQRETNSVADLSLNNKLNSAAQAKANDMVARNYWSHNGPDGSPWWQFINNAGYSYSSAGENLAYGFLTSNDTVTGWMNSPGHRANMLNGTFSEVGFGFANSADFNGSGEETVVVAEYGQPTGGAAPAAVATTPAPKVQAQTTTPAPAPATTETAPAPAPVPITQKSTTSTKQVSQQKKASTEPPAVKVSRLQMVLGDSAPWAATMVSVVAIGALISLLLKHGFALRRVIVKGERYVLHHALFDVTIVSLLGLCFIISRTAVFIR